MQEISTAEFYVVGEAVRSSSGKTVKIYAFENGKRVFIGQIACKQLREILSNSCLKADIQKYRNASEVKKSEC